MGDRASASLTRLFDLLAVLASRRARDRELPSNLTTAAWRGNLEMVELYLSRGASLEPQAGSSISPLAAAMQSGREDIVRRLLAAGARADSKGAAGTAARLGRIDLLDLLFDAGLDPASSEGRWAATNAATAGKAATLNFLLERGVTLSDADKSFTARNLESVGMYPETVAFLRGEIGDPERLQDASDLQIFTRDLPDRPEDDWSEERLEAEALEIVTSGSVDDELDRRDAEETSVLQAAIRAEALRVANALLDRGASPLPTAVIEAAEYGLAPIVARLAASTTDLSRSEALIRAAAFGLPEMVETLLRSGADPTTENRVGQTAFGSASGPYREEIQSLLRQAIVQRGGTLGPALVCAGKPRTRVAGLRGARELVKSQRQTNPSWAVIAFRSPIAEITPRLSSVYGARTEIAVEHRGVEPNPNGVFLFQLAGHPWTIELRSLGFHWRGRMYVGAKEAVAISKDADCELLLCSGSDASQTFGAVHCERGALRSQKEWDLDQARQSDESFAGIDLFLPGCRVDPRGFGARLEIDRIDLSAVNRVDYMIFGPLQ